MKQARRTDRFFSLWVRIIGEPVTNVTMATVRMPDYTPKEMRAIEKQIRAERGGSLSPVTKNI